MKPTLDTAIHLLHSVASGALATHSSHMPDYPFASALPFVPDERHRPVFLLSGLAEHTKNLIANPHASLLVTEAGAEDVLTAPRMTIIGDALRLDVSDEFVARFVRYQPSAEQYLALGDFAFFTLVPKRVRYIGGFAQMGWIEDVEWANAAVLPCADEDKLGAELSGNLPADIGLLGIDRYGIDIIQKEKRERRKFPTAPETGELAASVRQLLAG